MLFLILSFFLRIAAQPEFNDEVLAAKIDRYMQSAVDAYKFNGVVLVARQGRQIFHKAYGWKNIAEQMHNDTTTVFPILSITKSFTAMVMLKLQEQNKLSLKDPLGKYLPDFPGADKVTLLQLLTHQSGIHNYTDDIGEEDSALVNHPVGKNYVVDHIASKPYDFTPGKGFAYNNSGYYLAGLVIEKVTGKTYEQNVRELLFEPLQMNSSGFDFNGLPTVRKACGYQFLNDKQQKPYTYVDSTVGYSAGAIYSTTTDMYKWTKAIARQQLLSPASWKTALTQIAGDYGIGFRLGQLFGNSYIRHSGGYPGFASEFIYHPKQEVTIILLRNTGTYGEDLWPVTMGISCITLGLPYDNWKQRTEITLPAAQLEQYTGTFGQGRLKISFQIRDHQLHAILPGGLELPMLAENSESFYFVNYNSAFRFLKNKNGTYHKVIVHEHGKDVELKKVR